MSNLKKCLSVALTVLLAASTAPAARVNAYSGESRLQKNFRNVLQQSIPLNAVKTASPLSLFGNPEMLKAKSSNLTANDLVTRIAGSNRYDTSITVAQKGWTSSKTVIIASGDNFADALCAAPFAKLKDAPIILVQQGKTLSSNALTEIKALKPSEAYIIGGTTVVPDSVITQLKNISTIKSNVYRLSGRDRFATSVEIAKEIGTDKGIVVSNGLGYADVVSIAPVASNMGMPILLTGKSSVPDVVTSFLSGKNIPKTYVVGGTVVISDSEMNMFKNAERVSGNDRFATNIKVIKKFEKQLSFNTVYVTTGMNFPDSIVISSLAAKNNSPLVLVYDNISAGGYNEYLPGAAAAYIKNTSIKSLVIVGGTAAVSTTIEDNLDDLVNNKDITNIDIVNDTVRAGEKYNFPERVLADMSDGSQRMVIVNWDASTADTSTEGVQTFQGTVADYAGKVTLNLTISPDNMQTNGYAGNCSELIPYGDWIYYSSTLVAPFDRGVFSIKTDSNQRGSEYDDNASHINIIGNLIYFLHNNQLYNMNLDCTSCRLVLPDAMISYYIDGKYIYYINGNNSGIVKQKLDGTDRSEYNLGAANFDLYNLILYKDTIYFETDNAIYKLPEAGGPVSKVADSVDHNYSMAINEDYIYYINKDDFSLYRTSTNGMTTNRISNQAVQSYSISGRYIYYSSDDSGIYRAVLDGTNTELLRNVLNISGITVYGDSIYCVGRSGMCKMYIDGTDTHVMDSDLPGTPTDISATTPDNEIINLSWGEVPYKAAGFVIYESNNLNGPYYAYYSTDTTSAEDYFRIPQVCAYYKVVAVDSNGIAGSSSDACGVNMSDINYEFGADDSLPTATSLNITNDINTTQFVKSATYIGDLDYYKINIAVSSELNVCAVSSNMYNYFYIGLIDSSGNPVFSYAAASDGTFYYRTRVLKPGTYYIAILDGLSDSGAYGLLAWTQ